MNMLEKILLSGMRRMWWLNYRYGKPIVLKGAEGIILRDLLQAVADDQEDRHFDVPERSRIMVCGGLFFSSSPVLCEHELSKQQKQHTYHGYIS